MNKEELLKEIMKLPKVETNNPIRAMNGINVDDLMSAVDRLNKVPDYNGLLKENKELKKQVEDLFSENRNLRKKLENCMTFEDYKYTLNKKIKLETQQKEFIKYLENYMKQMVDDYGSFKYDKTSVTSGEYKAYKEILQKYKEIIGGNK